MVDQQRDARLVLRAEDRATKTFDNVGKSVRELTKTLEQQARAAADGSGSLEDLTKTLREIEAAGKDLETQRSAIRAFERTSEAAEKAAERVARSTKAYDDYKTKLDAAGKTTEAQNARLERLAATVEKSQTAFDQQGQRVDSARERLASLGLSADNTAQQLDDVREVFQRLTPLYAQATTAVNGYAAAQEKAQLAAKQQAQTEADAVKRATDEAAAAKRIGEQRFRTQQALAAQRAAEEASAERAAAAAAKETAQLESQAGALRQSGQAAIEASTNLNRFAQTGEAATVGLTRLAEAVRSVVQPTLAEVQSLNGAIGQIDASAEIASSKQKQRVSQYQDALNQLSQAQAGLVRQATNIDAYNAQLVAVDKLDAELGKASLRYEELGRAAAAAVAPNDALAKELAEAGRELERVGTQTLAARKRFTELQDGLKRAGIDTNNLADELVRLEAAARKSAVVADTLTTKVGGNGKGFLGLKSYELTNLGYQVNDIFTSLASGISPVQTLAQQGPQIAQLFPNILLGAARLLPVLGPIAAGLAAVVYQILQIQKQADATRDFAAAFALSGQAATLSADQFGKAQVELQRLNLSAKEAQTTLRGFIDAGLDPAGLNVFLDTVKQIAKATGEDIPAAAEKYAAALSGGYDQVVALNDITHTLNDTQLEEVQRLFDAGQAQEARTKVAEIYQAKAQEIANQSKGEWAEATDSLGRSFSQLNDTLHFTEAAGAIARGAIYLVAEAARQTAEDIQKLTNIVKGFAIAAALARGQAGEAASLLNGGGSATGSFFGKNVLAKAPRTPVKAKDDRSDGGQAYLRQQQTALKNAKLLTAEQRLQVAEQDAANAAAKAGATDAEIALAKANARRIEQAKLDTEAATRAKAGASAAKKAENEADAAARKAEARQNKINGLTKDLENVYDSLGANKADDPFAAIQAKADVAVRNIRAKFAELAKLGVSTVGGKSQTDFEAQVAAAARLETQQARIKQNEDDVNKLLEQRKILLAGIEDRVKSGELTPVQGIEEANRVAETLDGQIGNAAASALDFAKSLRGATFDPKLEAMITKLTEVGRTADTRQGFVTIGLNGLKEAQDALDAIVAKRDAVVELQNALVKAGLKTPAAAQEAIKAAFDNSRPAILAAADAVQQIIDKLLLLPGLSPTIRASLEAANAALVGTRAETKLLDADLVSLKNSAVQALSQSIGDFITTISNSVAEAIDGTKNLGDVLSDIGNAALSFAASFTQAIAQAIVQLVALKIAKAALNSLGVGVFHAGGVVGQGGGRSRQVSPLAFAGAVRYHTGGLAGLAPDEVPAILQRGERVLTEQQNEQYERNKSAGGGATPAVTLKNINLFNPADALTQGANTLEGEQAILNVIHRNKQSLGLPA